MIYCYSITFFEVIVIVSAIKKIVIASYSGLNATLKSSKVNALLSSSPYFFKFSIISVSGNLSAPLAAPFSDCIDRRCMCRKTHQTKITMIRNTSNGSNTIKAFSNSVKRSSSAAFLPLMLVASFL